MDLSRQWSAIEAARALLFVPATRPERFEKALASGAEFVIVDLEDAVAAQEKPQARAALLAAWPGLSDQSRCLIRINGVESDEHRADVALCGKLRPSGIIVPKVESEEDLAALGSLFADCALLPLIESAKGWQSIGAIAQVPSVVRLVFGSLDFQADLDLQAGPEEAELLPVRLSIVAASRAADLAAPIDGVTLATTDLEAVGKAAQRARRLGFGGKLCIHPRQVESVQHAFLPTAAELAWATRVVQAAQSAGGAAVQVDGQMVDRPVVLLAERIMARAG